MEILPLSGALGAEITGLDLSRPLDGASVAAVRRVLLDHLVVFFRDQHLGPAEQVAFARSFGPLGAYPFVQGLDRYPDVINVEKLPDETINFGGIWHSDTSYLAEPPMGTVLYALKVPPVGGDTLFANMVQAYESLSEGMKRLLGGLVAVNRADKAAVFRTRAPRIASAPKDTRETVTEAEHPAVRTHPETGRKALYVNVAHTTRFKGMTEAESAPILDYLFEHQTLPEFTCRFRWTPGALAFWDNRCCQHNPVNDYDGHHRVMHRVTIAGERPR